jgi:hypothetical protein
VTSVSVICINGHRGWLNGEVLSAPPRQPKGEKNHHSPRRDMMVASSHVLASIPGGKYPMGI